MAVDQQAILMPRSIKQPRLNNYLNCCSCLFFFLAATVVFSGCHSAVPVEGVVLLDDSPLTCSGSQSCKLVFFGDDTDSDQPQPITVSVDPTGRFTAPDLPSGEYRVVVHWFEQFPFDDQFATHFRDNPDAVVIEVDPLLPVEVHVSRKWSKKK